MLEFTGTARARALSEFEVREAHDGESLEPMVVMRVLGDSEDEPDRVFWLLPATERILGAELLTQGTRMTWGSIGGVPPYTA